MPAREFKTVKLVAWHEPDSTVNPGPDGVLIATELPGFVYIGAEVDGVLHKLTGFKAAKFLAKYDAAKSAGSKTPE